MSKEKSRNRAGYRFSIQEEGDKDLFDKLFDIFKELITHTSGDFDEAMDWLEGSEGPGLERDRLVRAEGGILRQLHSFLKEKDPGFGGLRRVQNKRLEFLWVHESFVEEY